MCVYIQIHMHNNAYVYYLLIINFEFISLIAFIIMQDN